MAVALVCSVASWAGILDGWTKMETNVIANPQNYYFIILHSDNSLMLGVAKSCSTVAAGTNNDTTSPTYDFISYQTTSEPCLDLNKVWSIESCTAQNYTSAYVLRSLGNVDNPANTAGTYQWELKTDGHVHEKSSDAAAFNLVYSNSYWNIQDATATTFYWGAWSNAAYVNNERVAGNAEGNPEHTAKGSYNIYYMSRSTFNQKYQFFGGTNMNHAIVNRDFEYGTATGWTSTYDQTDFKRSGDAAGSANAEVSPQSGNVYLYLWKAGGPATLTQTVSNLPDGKYSSTIYLCNDMDYYFKGTNAASTGSNTPADTWTEVTVSNQDISDGSADIQVWSWWDGAADNASLTYVPNNVSDGATAYTLGTTTTALTWYSITIPESGDYILMSTAASSILYTASSSAKPAGTEKATLDAGGTLALDGLTAGTLYVGTTTATKLALVKATGGDLTYYITNPSFESDFTGWTNPMPMQTQTNDSFSKTGAKYAERWQASNSGGLSNGTLTQSVPTLPAGTYKLTAKAQNVEQYNGDAKGTGFYLTAGSDQVMVGTNVLNTAYATLADAGSLTIGAKTQSCSGNWIAVDDFQLTYVTALPTGSEIEALKESGNMNATVSTAQTNAVDTYKSSQTAANCNAALSAIANAQVSKAYYELMNTLITDAPTTYNITTKLDAAGQTEWSSLYATIQSNYDSGIYETVDEVKTALSNAHIAAIKAQGPSSDWTDLLRNPSFEESVDGWTCPNITSGPNREANHAASDRSYYAGFWKDNVTGSIDLHQRVTLPAGFYRLEFDAYNNGDNNPRFWKDVQLYFGETESGKQPYNEERGSWQTFGFEFEVNEESTENLGARFFPTENGSIWEHVDNFRLTYVGLNKEVTVSAKAGKYGTVIFPFTPDVTGDAFNDITFYSCSSVNSTTKNVLLTEVDKEDVAANTPYLIKNNGGEDFRETLSGWNIATEDSYTVGLLTGVLTASTIPAGANHYVLQTQPETGQAFYLVETAFTATPYKCYLNYVAPTTPVKAFYLDFDSATGITKTTEKTEGTESLFDLSGRCVSKAQKGLYIMNGKKVMVK